MIKGQRITKKLKDRLEEELETNEKLQWLDMPSPHYFKPPLIAAFILGIIWIGFSIFWIRKYGALEDPIIAFIIGVPISLIGFVILLVSTSWAFKKPLLTGYAITDRRAIIIEEWGFSCVQSFYPVHLQDIYCREQKNGRGDVIITSPAIRESKFISESDRLGFLRVKNPKEVGKKLNELAEKSVKTDPSSSTT